MFESKLNRGASNGYTPLDGNQKVPLANLPAGVIGVLASSGTTIYSIAPATSGFSSNYSFFIGDQAGSLASGADYSVFVGQNAGQLATSAASSNFFGLSAGQGAIAANNSNFFGQQAGQGATAATQSNFFGSTAGYNATNASFSNFFGNSAGLFASQAYNSTFFGYQAGAFAINASNSNFFGQQAGYNASGSNNSNFFGYQAGQGATNAGGSNFFGFGAGQDATGADDSTFFGTLAGSDAINANGSVFIGINAGAGVSGTPVNYYFGSNFIGPSAGSGATVAFSSNFIGDSAGQGATGASNSNFIGYKAGMNATDAQNSTFIGFNAGQDASFADNSVFIGQVAGYQASGAVSSNFIGQAAGDFATEASYSNFMGYSAGYGATGATNSVFMGTSAGNDATDAADSNFMGLGAGFRASGANSSNFIGYYAGNAASGASYSTFIGFQSGYNPFTGTGVGSNNIIIGTNVTLQDGTTNSFNFGGVLFGKGMHNDVDDDPVYSPASGGSIGIGVIPANITNRLHISAATNPVRIQGLTASTSDTSVISIDSNGVLHSYTLTNISGGSGANIYNTDGILTGNRIVDVSSNTLTFSSATQSNNLVLSGGNVGIGVANPTNRLYISATTNPIRIQGLSATTLDTSVISIDSNGVLHSYALTNISGGTGSNISVTGGTYSAGTATFTNNTGGTFNVTGFTNVFYGTIYNKSSWSNLNDFTNVGATANVVSNQIVLSGGNQFIGFGNNAVYNQYLRITGGTLLERWKFQANIQINSIPSATTYGFGIGTISTSDHTAGNVFNAVGYFNMTNTGSTGGSVTVLAGNGNTNVANSLTGITISQNDVIQLITERVDNTLYVIAKNITTSSATVSTTYEYDTTSATGVVLPNTSNFSIVSFGGTFTIQNINITSNVIKYADVMFVGDSKTAGYSTGYDVRYTSLIGKNMSNIITCAGASDTTQSVLNHLPEMIALRPKKVALCIGRNDDSFGVLSGTWQSNYTSIVNQLTAATISVVHLNGFFESIFSSTAVPNYINANWSPVIKTYEGTHVAGTISADNIHPSTLGHQIGANIILSDGSLGNSGYNAKDPVYDIQTFAGINIVGTFKNVNALIPTATTTGDIIMAAGNALRSAFVLNTQQTGIVLADNNAIMTFRNYYGSAGNPTGGGFQWYTGLATLGSQTLAMNLSTNGVLRVGSNITQGFTTTTGDIGVGLGGALYGATTATAGNEGRIIPYSSLGHTEFRNYQQVGQIRMFVSNNVVGGQLQALTITSGGTVLIGTTTDSGVGKLQVSGDINMVTAGNALRITEGTNGRVGQTSLSAGTKTLSISGLTTTSRPFITLDTASGTTLTRSYQANCSANTLTIRANIDAGTINTADTSTLNYFVLN